MEVDNVVVAEDDIIRIQFHETAIVHDSHCQGDIPMHSTMILCIAKTSNVHRAYL
jgi:hypothetical protein